MYGFPKRITFTSVDGRYFQHSYPNGRKPTHPNQTINLFAFQTSTVADSKLFNNFSLFVSLVIFLINVNIYGPQWKLLNFQLLCYPIKSVSQSVKEKQVLVFAIWRGSQVLVFEIQRGSQVLGHRSQVLGLRSQFLRHPYLFAYKPSDFCNKLN